MYSPEQQFRHNYYTNGQQPPLIYPEPPTPMQEPPRPSLWNLLFLFALVVTAFILGTFFNRRKKNPIPDWVKGIRKPATDEPAKVTETDTSSKSDETIDADWLAPFSNPKPEPMSADDLWLKIGRKYHSIENADELGLNDTTENNPSDSSQDENLNEEEQ
jgi:hypothetical protein